MTPKEKAIQLRDKYIFISFDTDEDYKSFKLKLLIHAKQCALIAVDEIIESKPSFPIEGKGGYLYEDIELSTEWWKKVRKEIEKL
jgi:hypothetical protein